MVEQIAEIVTVTGTRSRNAMPFAAVKIMLGSIDLADKIDPRFLRLDIVEKAGGEADEFTLEINDNDGNFDIPKRGVTLSIALGWTRGAGLPIGIVSKGTFKIDEASFDGPPDKITIKGRSANFTKNFHTRRAQNYHGDTLQSILSAIAAREGVKLQLDSELKSQIVPAIAQTAQSDADLLRSLSQRFDAIGSIKNGILLFTKIGEINTPRGTKIPSFNISRNMTSHVSFEACERDNSNGVEAVHHDKATGQKHLVREGHNPNDPRAPRRLKKRHHNAQNASHHAKAANGRAKRAGFKLNIDLAYGRPDLFPNQKVTLEGFKSEIQSKNWVIKELNHSLDGSGGLQTRLSLESP